MSAFIRRFTFDPGEEVLLEIESVNILDLDPPATISGVGSGTVLLVGEFENGPLVPTEVNSGSDMLNIFGGLGYSYGGGGANYPCARKRFADSAIDPEYWNGNGFVQLSGKRFRRLILQRVDTSVGSVVFNRQAFVKNSAAFAYNIEPAQTLIVDVGNGPVTATFNATAALLTSAAGVYPTTFAGGETIVFQVDKRDPIIVTFQAVDSTQTQAIARVNAAMGFTFAADAGGGVTTFTGLVRGTDGKVAVVSGTPLALTAFGIAVGSTLGTGNVANIDAVRYSEIKSIVEAAVTDSMVEQDPSGAIRIARKYAAAGDYVQIGAASTASGLLFTAGAYGSNDGIARVRSAAGTYPLVGAGTLILGVDASSDVSVSFAIADTQADVINKINAALGYTAASSVSATIIAIKGKTNGGQVRISGGTSLAALGLTIQTVVATTVISGIIPAGTVVQNAAASNVFVTYQDVEVKSSKVGPYEVKVRHAVDDGTGLSATAGTIVSVATPALLHSFACVNNSTITTAKTEGQIDAAYSDAIDKTLDMNGISKDVNVIYAARQSNTVRRKLRENANLAGSKGLLGRMAVIRPPMGTKKSDAKSTVNEPGVGAYRSQRVIYCYPQAATFVPAIARVGSAGGEGFTADGVVDVGADGFMASVLSQLPPEENPGQENPFLDAVFGLESSPNVKGFEMSDYTSFKQSGIAAIRIDGAAVFQSGITSVDPQVQPQLKNIARRRMADFIQDTLALRMKNFSKKLNAAFRRRVMGSEIRVFLEGLLSVDRPQQQRIAGFTLDTKSGNTKASLAKGINRIIINVRTLSSMDSIVLATSIGESVEVEEVLPEAA